MKRRPHQTKITPDKLRERTAAGLKADLILQAMSSLYDEREQKSINEIITWFRSESWDERTAIRYIAALSENRAQREELEHRVRMGEEARKRLYGDQTVGQAPTA